MRLARLTVPVPLTLALLVALAASAAQPGKVYRIGHVTSATRSQEAQYLTALEEGLRQLGYAEGQNLRLEYRFADGNVERLPELIDEVVRLNVDVIVAGSNQTVAIAKRATTTIPIVMTLTADPVGAGFVASLGRPGGNITGLAIDVTPDIAGKRLALLKEAVPTVSRIAVLWEPALSPSASYWHATQQAAGSLRLTLRSYEVSRAADLDTVLDTISREGTDGLSVFLSPLTLRRATEITASMLRRRLPAVYGVRAFVERGGLVSYGPVLVDSYRRAATYVDRILKGAKPADLPVEQPTKFELVINLKTAKALGLTIPPAMLGRADELIQ
jgi:putative ABC transport system substrate-binding protein